jgi:two-component system CheB/CheR fusion protein
MNEELQATNEELETSKEEIQSVNEELQTVNQELSAKLEQLDQANADLKNLFASTRIAVIFLDRNLSIRSFTPAATAIFSLIPSDQGRPLTDIASQLGHPDLDRAIAAVVSSGQESESRVATRDGRAHHLMRILPYRVGGRVEGAILTFVDVTTMVEAERQKSTLVDELNHRVRNILTVVLAVVRRTLARTKDPSEFAEAVTSRIAAMALTHTLVAREGWGEVPLEAILRAELEPHLADGEQRIALAGPTVQVWPAAAMALGMAVHELATNATKHGALSAAADGRLAIHWKLEKQAGGPRLVLDWQEAGGPPVRQPPAKGFGSELLESAIRHELGGEVTSTYREDGIAIRLEVPWRPRLS